MNTFGTRLKALRKERKLTQKQLGRAVGVTDVTVGYWEKDQNTPGGVSLTKLARYFGVSEDFLLSGRDDESNVTGSVVGSMLVPVLSWVQAGVWTSESDARNLEGTIDYIPTNGMHSFGTFALKVKGKSMEPEFKEGDTIIVDPDLCPNPGDYVVAKNGSEYATFKKYRAKGVNEKGENVFELIPLNPDFAPINSSVEKISIIGVVVEHRRQMRR